VRSALLGLVSAALVLTATPTARAETWAMPDPRGDVRVLRYDPDNDPCAHVPEHRNKHDRRRDVRDLAVDHGVDDVAVTLTLGDVDRHDRSTTYSLHLRTPRRGYFLDYRPLQGDADLFLAVEPDYPSPSEIKDCSFAFSVTDKYCDGLAGDLSPRTDQLVVTIPRSCLGGPSWVRVAANVYGFSKTDAEGRFAISSDFWAPRGVKRRGFVPPFGPRVHAEQSAQLRR